MKNLKKYIRFILALYSLMMLGAGIIGYIEFLNTWGFVAIDVVFMVWASAIVFVSLNGKKLPRILKIGALVLLVAWPLTSWFILPKNSRLSELQFLLLELEVAFCGLIVSATKKYWLHQDQEFSVEAPVRIHKP